MNLRVLLIFLCLETFVSAYDQYGAYERMFFHYAYLIDAHSNGGTPTKIAPACGKVMGVGAGQRCSFNQFIQFINDDPNRVSIDDSLMPDVDRTAAALRAAGLTNTYNILKIMRNIDEDPGTLFKEVRKVVQNRIDSATKKQLKSVRTAISRVADLRGYENMATVERKLLEKYPTIDIKKTPKVINGQTYEYLDKG